MRTENTYKYRVEVVQSTHRVCTDLEAFGVETPWRVGTVRRLARKLGSSFKHDKGALFTKLTLDERHDVRPNVREKIEFFMSGLDHGPHSGAELGRNSHAIVAHEHARLGCPRG